MKMFSFSGLVLFRSPRGNSGLEHGSLIIYSIFACFTLSLSTLQVNMIQERCWFSQIDFFVKYFPHRINVLLLSSQFYVVQQTRIILLHDVQMSIPNCEVFPNRAPTEFSRCVFPTKVLLKDDRADFVREERLGLPHWTMIQAACVVVVNKYLDIPIWEFSAISEHVPF